jgi:hypothetical protein
MIFEIIVLEVEIDFVFPQGFSQKKSMVMEWANDNPEITVAYFVVFESHDSGSFMIGLSTCIDSVVVGLLDSIKSKIRKEGSIFSPSSISLSSSSCAFGGEVADWEDGKCCRLNATRASTVGIIHRQGT